MPDHHLTYRFPPLTLLAWLGRQGAHAVAVLVFLGIAVPPLGTLLRPYVTEAIFLLLTISFSRVDTTALQNYFRRPALVVAATAWTGIAVPLLFAAAALGVKLNVSAPGLFLGLMLQGVTSPMMAAPALAGLAGLDATIVLITLVTGTALVPFVAPLFAYEFLGNTLTISPPFLALNLVAVLAGSFVLATIIRGVTGASAIERHGDPINGFNILLMLVFVTAVMGDVVPQLLANPTKIVEIALLAFGVFFALLFLTALVFWRAGRTQALSLGLMASQRNMGVMLAATDGILPGTTWLYFALCQFPIYLSPLILRLIVRVPGGSFRDRNAE
jgi:BASS family bile acid:Na+ symporter